MAAVGIVELERQRFLARTGFQLSETPRSTSICSRAMMQGDILVFNDVRRDPRMAAAPAVTGSPYIRFYAGAPLISFEGAPLGALCVVDLHPRKDDLTELQRDGMQVLSRAVMQRLMIARQDNAAVAATRSREIELQKMLDSVPGISWTCDGDGNFDRFNARWKEATGAEPPRTAEECEPFIHPDDYLLARPRWDEALKRAQPFSSEWRLRLADGSYRWMLVRALPVVEDNGGTRWFGTLIDIEDAHHLSESRELLVQELGHRIKNIFAVVSGLIAMRARGRENVRSFADEISATIGALGKANDYVQLRSGRKSDDLAGLLCDLLAPYQSGDEDRVLISGDHVSLGARAATPLALIFHELATNSAKYGSLGVAGGHVAITVTGADSEDQPVSITWEEHAPGFAPPEVTSEGFGSRLLRMAIERQLGGSIRREFGKDGLQVALSVPATQLGA